MGRKKNSIIREEQLAKFKEIQDYLEKVPNMIDVGIKAGLAIYGMKAFNHPAGALIALVAFELAKSQNIVAGGSGVGTLAMIGLTAAKPETVQGMKIVSDVALGAAQAITPFKLPFGGDLFK